jgi:tRNA A-37 threonylcarbamoyl transferase component Bud32
MPELTTEDLVGIKLGERYEVVEPISSGAMGAVYKARDTREGDEVAVKRLLDVQHATRFTIEARLLARLNHPRVVRLVDHFTDQTGNYLVMELIQGEDLSRRLARLGDPGLPIEEALNFAAQACQALDYLHQQQIVHRDVKPQNLVLGAKGLVLVDLGIAREMEGDEVQGTIGVGTPRFMAPEVLSGSVSARTDVFSLAATLWTLITGSPPVYGDRAPLSDRVPGVATELEEALRAGLEFMPERRITSAAAFAAAVGRPFEDSQGASLAISLDSQDSSSSLIEAVVKTAAGVFDAAAASIALLDRSTEELVYRAAWGAGAAEIVGTRLARGEGIAGSVVASGEPVVVPRCSEDPRFAAALAAGTGYVPNTMLLVPLRRAGRTVGVLSLLDRRDGGGYGPDDVGRASLFSELALAALELGPSAAAPVTIAPTTRPAA